MVGIVLLFRKTLLLFDLVIWGLIIRKLFGGKRRVIDVTLTENSVVIDDVVVIAYGTKKRRDMIGSVSKN